MPPRTLKEGPAQGRVPTASTVLTSLYLQLFAYFLSVPLGGGLPEDRGSVSFFFKLTIPSTVPRPQLFGNK